MTTTTTTSGASAVQTATKSLLTSLGSGSGVDTAGLITSLVEAQFAARAARLTKQTEKLTAQISGVSTIKSAISGFASALDSLAKGGSLATQPRSSNPSVLGATALPGAKLAALSASVRVDRLASGQNAVTTKVMAGAQAATRGTVLGSGSFTLQLGTAATTTADGVTSMGPFTPSADADTSVSFTLTDASVDSIAAAINAQGARLGISAAVVTGADGSAYLSLKGATGAAKAFTLAVSGDAGLAQFAVGEGSTLNTAAQNAALTVDGVSVERASNAISDLVAGVKLELAQTGTTQLTPTKPTAALTQAVEDVVATYNEVIAIITAQTDAKSGTLNADPAAQALLRALRGMTLSVLNGSAAAGEPRTLAEIGVRTARDGTLSVDSASLSKALAASPDAVEAMFVTASSAAGGLPALLNALSASATSATSGLGTSNARYVEAQQDVEDAEAKIGTESEAMTNRLTAQFAAMNARVSAYKSVQTFLTNQIAAWNKSDG